MNNKIQEMTYDEFQLLPRRKWDQDIGQFDSLVILPAKINLLHVLIYKIRLFMSKLFHTSEPELYTIHGIELCAEKKDD